MMKMNRGGGEGGRGESPLTTGEEDGGEKRSDSSQFEVKLQTEE